MFLGKAEEGDDRSPLKLHWLQYLVLAVCAIPTLGLGLFFGQATELAVTDVRLLSAGM